jgi:rubrerythrin
MPKESHEPVNSIRWEVIRKAMEDYEYLYLLREVAEGKNEHARALLQELNQKVVPNFVEHTRDANYLENFRRNIARVIAEAQ